MQYYEDKKCRICGLADAKNINIFSSYNSKTFVMKMLTVYPIIFYENDPLPQNICKNCMCNVSFMYNDVQRVLKTQRKWISNVRSVQPDHKYIKIIDVIEDSNAETRESIKSTLGEDICLHSINRLFFTNNSDEVKTELEANPAPSSLALKIMSAKKPTTTFSSSNSVIEVTNAFSTEPSPKENHTKGIIGFTEKSSGITEIKSLLELNGCTLLAVDAKKPNKDAENAIANIKTASITGIPEGSIDEDDVALAQFATSKTNEYLLDAPPPLTVKCRYCPMQFNTLAALATHQLIHMRISIPKSFEKKYLNKSLRKGRLITVQERQCIRCLNCWRIFIDNKSILNHWTLGECDFYCHICGTEYPQTPKMLREHVSEVHDISYRSSKMQRTRAIRQISMDQPHSQQPPKTVSMPTQSLPDTEVEQSDKIDFDKASTSSKIQMSSSPPLNKGTVLMKNVDGSVTCLICNKVFHNVKARNSHMRKHKPSYAYGDLVVSPNASSDAYVQMESIMDPYSEEDKPTTTATVTAAMQVESIMDPYSEEDKPTTTAKTTAAMQVEYIMDPYSEEDKPTPTATVTAATISTEKPSTATISTAATDTIMYTQHKKVQDINKKPCLISPASPHSSSPATCTTTIPTVIRGVRTKFVNRRSVINTINTIKLKPISDLQDTTPRTYTLPAATTVANNANNSTPIWVLAPRCVMETSPMKDEPMDEDHHPAESLPTSNSCDNVTSLSSCVSCGATFASRPEFLRHEIFCNENQFVKCKFCDLSFYTRTDYHLHLIERHNCTDF